MWMGMLQYEREGVHIEVWIAILVQLDGSGRRLGEYSLVGWIKLSLLEKSKDIPERGNIFIPKCKESLKGLMCLEIVKSLVTG